MVNIQQGIPPQPGVSESPTSYTDQERIVIEVMTSDRKRKESRQGST